MKKLFGSLMALTLISSSTSIVVACARGPKMHKIETKFSQTEVSGVDYKQEEMWDAFNGTPVTFYGNVSPLNQLSRNILNLLGFNHNFVTQPKYIVHWREFYLGEDKVNEDEKVEPFSPSVDGVFYDGAIGKDQGDFYNLFQNTQINSIEGLYQLYQYDQNNPGTISGEGALKSLEVIKSAYQSSAVQEFIASFLDLDNMNLDSSWLSQKFDFGENADLSSLKLDSRVVPFDSQIRTKDNKKINELVFTGKDLDKPVGFTDLNTGIELTPDAKVGNNKSQPFDLLLLPPQNQEDIPNSSQAANFNLGWEYDDKKSNGLNAWDVRKASDGWKFNATDKIISEEGSEVVKGYIKTNDSIVVPLKPLHIQYEYSTNVRSNFPTKYLVSLEIDGIQAMFNPIGYQTKFKDSEKDSQKHGNRYMKWQFSHYQFNDINNVYSPYGNKQITKVGNGYYSGFKITSMKVDKI